VIGWASGVLFDAPYELHRDSTNKVIYIAEARSRIRKLIFTKKGKWNDGLTARRLTVAGR